MASEVKIDNIAEAIASAGVEVTSVLKVDEIEERTTNNKVKFPKGIKTDTIDEKTADAGVTIDGVLLKDAQVSSDTINELTLNAGVTVDGVLLKDAEVSTDVINEETTASGVTIDGALIKDNTFLGNVTVEASETLDVSAGTLTLANDQISGDAINGGTISNFASTGIDDNADALAMTIDASEQVGIGTVSPDGTLHVHSGSAGTVTAPVAADEIVAEGSGTQVGISILGNDTSKGYLMFGAPLDNDDAFMLFDRAASRFEWWIQGGGPTVEMALDHTGLGIGTATPGATLDVRGDAVFNEDGGDNDFRVEGDTEPNLIFANAGDDRVGFGLDPNSSAGKVQIKDGTSDNAEHVDMSILSGGSGVAEVSSYTATNVDDGDPTIIGVQRGSTGGGFIIVEGDDGGGGNRFTDILIMVRGQQPTTVSGSDQGSPGTRTYSATNGDIKLVMGAAVSLQTRTLIFSLT